MYLWVTPRRSISAPDRQCRSKVLVIERTWTPGPGSSIVSALCRVCVYNREEDGLDHLHSSASNFGRREQLAISGRQELDPFRRLLQDFNFTLSSPFYSLHDEKSYSSYIWSRLREDKTSINRRRCNDLSRHSVVNSSYFIASRAMRCSAR